jgi:hypothetical protein
MWTEKQRALVKEALERAGGETDPVKRLCEKARELEAREGHDFRPGVDLERLEARALLEHVLLDPQMRLHLEMLIGPVPNEVVARTRARYVSKALSIERGALVAERKTLKEILFAHRYSSRTRTDYDPSAHPGVIEEMETRFKQVDEELKRIDDEED